MSRWLWRFAKLMVVLFGLALLAAGWQYVQTRQIRQALYDAFEPAHLTNCTLERFGDANDGGYLLCGNLLSAVQVAYSYGINGVDGWGCHVADRLQVPLHQYDCFNPGVPDCNRDSAQFHNECVGPRAETIEGRFFDSVGGQLEKNGDAGKRLVVKMDVEGSEWESLRQAPDAVLNQMDQLVVEFHEVEKPAFIATVQRLKQLFHIAHVHQNNFLCQPGFHPFPGEAFEVLFVNKRIATAGAAAGGRGPSPLDAPNLATAPDCQASTGSEVTQIGRWLRRKGPGWYAFVAERVLPPY
jgi:hypothetical protein